VAVLTAVTPVHLEKFGNMEAVQREKARIWSRLRGVAVGNIDDEKVRMEISKVKTKTVTYGISEDATVRADGISVFTGAGEEVYEKIRGVAFKLLGDGSALPVHLPGVLGRSHLYAALAGAATGVAFGLNYHDIVEGLHLYSPLPGRMRLLPGIKHTLLIDDTYNASPAAMESALTELQELPINEGNKKFACLGDMLELGAESDSLHADIGSLAASSGIDILVCVGERSASIIKAAALGGMAEDHIFHFAGAAEAGKFVQDRIRRGDIILIKGSQSIRLERAVEEIMAEPDRKAELLVRQDPEWQVR
jgi:UDP-N-acetylmuramoyl-tripeptide--D-alanyl-D-alanine ligase